MKIVTFIIVLLIIGSASCLGQKLAIVSSKKFDRKVIASIKKKIYEVYGTATDSIGEFNPPANNDNVAGVINILKGIDKKEYEGLVALTDIPISIYYGGIFPEEIYGDTDSDICVVSDYLILKKHDDRMANVAAHEVGHIYGLDDCKNKHCLMVAAGHLDNKYLCSRCKRQLNRNLKTIR